MKCLNLNFDWYSLLLDWNLIHSGCWYETWNVCRFAWMKLRWWNVSRRRSVTPATVYLNTNMWPLWHVGTTATVYIQTRGPCGMYDLFSCCSSQNSWAQPHPGCIQNCSSPACGSLGEIVGRLPSGGDPAVLQSLWLYSVIAIDCCKIGNKRYFLMAPFC